MHVVGNKGRAVFPAKLKAAMPEGMRAVAEAYEEVWRREDASQNRPSLEGGM